MEQQKKATELRDCGNIKVQLQEMRVPFDDAKLKRFTELQQEVAQVLDPVNLSVNNNQFATAIAATCDDGKRQFLGVPSGMGKSRIIAAVIVLKYLQKGITRFTVVFTSKLLRSADQAMYKRIGAVLNLELELVVFNPRCPLDALVRQGHYAVIDEADAVLLDHA